MTVVDHAIGVPARGGRLVWGGRFTPRGLVPEATDGWATDRTDLLARLEGAAELVVLDALSLPWETFRDTDFDIPMVVVLPASCDGGAIREVLGSVVLDRLTPWDTVVESRADVRAQVVSEYGLDPDTVVDPGGDDLDDVVAWLRGRSVDLLDEVHTDLGTYRSQAGDLITGQLAEFGAHQRGVLNMLLALVRPDDVVVDVGAHIGTVAIPLAQRLSDGRVLAIEGHPATAGLLAHNVRENDLADRILVRHQVLGSVAGELVDPRHVGGNTGATAFGTRRRAAGGRSLRTARLDDTWKASGLPAPTIVKVDVEGAEFRVLRGAEAIVDEHPILVLEVSEEQLHANGDGLADLQDWLDDHGFGLFACTGVRNHAGGDWQLTPVGRLAEVADALFDVVAVPPGNTRLDELGLEGTA